MVDGMTVIMELLVPILVTIVGFFLGILKDRLDNLKFEDKFAKYKDFFNISGAIVKAFDEKLYIEMEEAIAEMTRVYQSEEFTTQAFNRIVKECADVFNRAQKIVKDRS